jgi:hypothetical protein
MTYRFIKVTTFSRYYLEEFYRLFPMLKHESYDMQYRALMADAYGWADFFSRNLQKLGVDAYEIVTNAGYMQRAWATERGSREKGTKLIEEQIATIRPDVVFFEDMSLFDDHSIAYLREKIRSLKLITGYVCSSIALKICKQSKAYNFVFCCGPAFTCYIRSLGLKAFELNHAFDADILNRINLTYDRPADIIFVGSLIPGKCTNENRIEILNDLLNSGINMRICTDMNPYRLKNVAIKNAVWYTHKTLNSLGLKQAANISVLSRAKGWDGPVQITEGLKNILRVSEKPRYGLEMYKAFAASKIAFNNHAQVAGDCSVNMRMFEATGAGACLVTDHKKNIKDFFEPDHEVVTYKCRDEALDKIKWLIEHPFECEKIAMAGHCRTLRDHTFYKRAQLLHSVILKELNASNQ